jgi:hypothetical protein
MIGRSVMALRRNIVFPGVALAAAAGFATVLPAVASLPSAALAATTHREEPAGDRPTVVAGDAAAGDSGGKALVYVVTLAPGTGERLGHLPARPVEHRPPEPPLAPVLTVAADGAKDAGLHLDQKQSAKGSRP